MVFRLFDVYRPILDESKIQPLGILLITVKHLVMSRVAKSLRILRHGKVAGKLGKIEMLLGKTVLC